MSDYINKSVFIEKTMEWVEELKNSPDEGERIYANDVELFVDEHIRTEPTLDEKEIIRKAFERVLKKLKKEKSDWNYDYNVPLERAIEIVKEECGINE